MGVGGIGVFVGGTGVFVGGTGVFVSGIGVFVSGIGVTVGCRVLVGSGTGEFETRMLPGVLLTETLGVLPEPVVDVGLAFPPPLKRVLVGLTIKGVFDGINTATSVTATVSDGTIT